MCRRHFYSGVNFKSLVYNYLISRVRHFKRHNANGDIALTVLFLRILYYTAHVQGCIPIAPLVIGITVGANGTNITDLMPSSAESRKVRYQLLVNCLREVVPFAAGTVQDFTHIDNEEYDVPAVQSLRIGHMSFLWGRG